MSFKQNRIDFDVVQSIYQKFVLLEGDFWEKSKEHLNQNKC